MEKRHNQSQWNFPIGEIVRGSTSLTMGTNLASSTSLNVTPVTIFTQATGKYHWPHDSRPLPTKSAETEPHLSLKHDDGQIHCTSPIYGLPPETIQFEGYRPATRHETDQITQQADTGSSLKSTREKTSGKLPSKLNLCLPLQPSPWQPDAHKGPEAPMPTIDMWFVSQASIAPPQMARNGLVSTNIPISIPCSSTTLQEALTMSSRLRNDMQLMVNPSATEKVPSFTEEAQPQQCTKKTDDTSQSSDKDQGLKLVLPQSPMHRERRALAQLLTQTSYNNDLEIVQTKSSRPCRIATNDQEGSNSQQHNTHDS